MDTSSILHYWLSLVIPPMHPKRKGALFAVVLSALRGRCLTVTNLGRCLTGKSSAKHNIKRADRLLSNEHLHCSRNQIYKLLAKRTLANSKHPLILIDWSTIGNKSQFFLLRASTPLGGRSLTLYEELHTVETKEKRSTHNLFLDNLRLVLPSKCCPTIVTDAGFQTPWFKKVESLGWNFVGRIRGACKAGLNNGSKWIFIKSLFSRATSKAKHLGQCFLNRKKPFSCQLILFKGKRKGRVKTGRYGNRRESTENKAYAKRNREPWLLVTSLECSAQEVVQIYQTRMQIEESFRDLKSTRSGLHLRHSSTYKKRRMEVLLLIGAIATTFAWLVGRATETNGQHRQFQANSIKNKSILSSFFIGMQVINSTRVSITHKCFIKALRKMAMVVDEYQII